ncbi:TPA: ead/Ea22-like family protein [Enterobacter cloacae]|nr:ead/Ea22-like family protein [Enterobacter cloacae]HEB0964535.1 ead/Ea22-like family protein [Enterobacter cloacae]
MSNINKHALREVAMSAPWGNWQAYKPHKGARGYEVKNGVEAVAQHCLKHDADFIAAANPKTVLALLDELEARDKSISFLKDQLAQLANFNPDWDKLEAATDSLREHMAELTAARKRIAELEARTITLKIKPATIGRAYSALAHVWTAQEVHEACAAAGISINGEG